MPWFRVDDTFAFNEKVIQAEERAPGAVSAWVRMGAHCAAQLTDGRISSAIANAIASKSQLDALLAVRFLLKRESGYEIHEYLKYQPSKAEVEADRERARDRMRVKRGHVRPNIARTSPVTSQEVLEGMGGDGKGSGSASEGERADRGTLPGNPSDTTRQIVDHWRAVAESVLDALNAARKRVHAGSRGISPSYDSLKHIADRLDAGKSVEDCLHVVEVCEAECRADAGSFKWFDAVSPFRPDNFERKCVAEVVPLTVTRQYKNFAAPREHIAEGYDEDLDALMDGRKL